MEKRAQVITQRVAGKSIVDICVRMKQGKTAVCAAYSRTSPLHSMEDPPQKQVLGRPSTASMNTWDYMKLELLRIYLVDSIWTQGTSPNTVTEGSIRTIQRAIAEKLKMPLLRAAMKPLITCQMCKKRLAFARKYLH